MLSETSIPGTDDWWLIQLAIKYGADLPRMYRMQSYMDGTNALPDEWDPAMREAYRRFLRLSRLGMAELSVSSRVNRMRALGFKTAAPGDDNGDQLALANWNRSHMSIGLRTLLTDAGALGRSYLIVDGPTTRGPQADPMIHPTNGFSTVTAQYAQMPWLAEAALFVGYDAINGRDVLTLFRPGYMRVAARDTKVSTVPTNGRPWKPGAGWSWLTDPVQLGFTDDVPVYQLEGPGGMGMFERHTDSLDRMTNTIRDRLTITAMQAFKQRAIEGELPQFYPVGHPQAGQAINYDEKFKAGPAALWALGTGAKVWESSTTDITPILTAIDRDIRQFAAVSATPLYILDPDSTNVAAGAAEKAGESLHYSILEWRDRADSAIHQALGTAFLAQGDGVRSQVGQISTIWAEIDPTSINDKASAAAQARAGGLSVRSTLEKVWQFTPEEIEQELQNQSDDAFNQVLTPTAVPAA